MLPTDFARRPRDLDCLKKWKATEFRLFLLYLGPIVLNKVFNKNRYMHFMSLHVAITILASPVFS